MPIPSLANFLQKFGYFFIPKNTEASFYFLTYYFFWNTGLLRDPEMGKRCQYHPLQTFCKSLGIFYTKKYGSKLLFFGIKNPLSFAQGI